MNTKNNKILFFFPHNPYPARSGAHRRCLEMLAGFKELGFEVTLMSSTLSSETIWEMSSIQDLKSQYCSDVCIYEPTKFDYKLISLVRRYYRITKQNPPISSLLNTPLGMCNWFAQKFESIKPEIIVMNYAYWDRLFHSKKNNSVRKIIDTYDLVSLNSSMQNAVRKYLSFPLTSQSQIEQKVLQEDFFDNLNLETSAEEFEIFDNYDRTIVISSKEIELIKSKTSKTQVVYIPVKQPCYELDNQYEGSAIFTIGPNMFNIQGYIYFIKRILPLILQKDSTFSLQVTGGSCKDIYSTTGVTLSGFVPNLKMLYQTSSFAICPVFGGTGQQIKITEAMAHGLPVVATRFAGERSPIIHAENGFIANDHQEFAEYTLKLWQDKSLCKRLGTNARETISANFSRDSLIKDLFLVVN